MTDRTVLSASEDSDRLGELRAMRLILARRIDDETTQAKDLPPLTKRLSDISAEIADIEAADEAERTDEGVDDGRPEGTSDADIIPFRADAL